MVYYQFSSSTMDPCSMSKPAYEDARRTWLCLGCVTPKSGTEIIEATIQETKPDNTPLNLISGCGIGIAQKDFLFGFGENTVRQHLYVGRVFSEDAGLMNRWVTFHGKHKIIVRGSKDAAYRRCPECGTLIYFALGKLYLYPTPPEGVKIFHSGSGSLVVTEDLAQLVIVKKWRKLVCTKLPVLDNPRDGLGDLGSP